MRERLDNTFTESLKSGLEIDLLGRSAAQEALQNDDLQPFFRHLTEMDRSIRLQRDLRGMPHEVQEEYFQQMLWYAAQPWDKAEAQELIRVCQQAESLLRSIGPDLLPNPWRFLKTTGQEEGQAAYVRSDVIVFPEAKLQHMNQPGFLRLLIHETAHVWSRLNPHKRDRIYARLGFERIPKVKLGPWLAHHRINNPDGTHINYTIEIEHQGRKLKAMPLLYTPKDHYAPDSGTLFDYVNFGLFEVDQDNGRWAIINPNYPRALSPREVSGFFEQITSNTQYILHPDEIFAANLELLALSAQDKAILNPLTKAGRKLLKDIKQIIQEPSAEAENLDDRV